MERKSVMQKINKRYSSQIDIAHSYLSILLSLNNIHVTKREHQLLSFIACRGISSVNSRQDFCSSFKSSQATIDNMVSRLSSLGVLIKENGKTKLHSKLSLDFDNDIVLNISISHA